MRITISGSMTFSDKMREVATSLQARGLLVYLPSDTQAYSGNNKEWALNKHEEAQKKIDQNLIKKHYEKIRNSDALLVVNENKPNTENYIGGNTFLEMGFAHILDKKIYILNKIPKNEFYEQEIIAMQPIVLSGNLDKLI